MNFNEWKEYNLDELCLEITDGSHSSPKTVEQGYPMASVKDMEYSKINLETCRKISKEDYEKLIKGKCKPEINDVLIAKDGSYLKYVNVVKEDIDLVLLSSIAILRPDIRKIDPDFFKYYLVNPVISKRLEQGYVSGSVIRRIVLKDFKKFKIKIPDIIVQKRIARILLDLDKKIEINNKINKKLEEMAQAIFKQWFVDFEFPNEDGKPYKSSGGEMVESELGMIPKGWNSKSLLDIADYLNGLAMQKFRPKDDEKGIPVLKIKELRQGKSDENSDLCSLNIDPKYIIHDGDVIFSWSGSLLVDFWCGGKCGLNQHLFKVTSSKFEKWFYYLWTKYHLDKFTRIAKDKATTMGHIKRADLSNSIVLVPNEVIMNKANLILNPIIEKIIEARIEERKLSQLRDTLLPKLMSGEIRVPID